MYPKDRAIWRPEKVVAFPIELSIGNVRTTGQCSIWTKIQQAMYTSLTCGYIF